MSQATKVIAGVALDALEFLACNTDELDQTSVEMVYSCEIFWLELIEAAKKFSGTAIATPAAAPAAPAVATPSPAAITAYLAGSGAKLVATMPQDAPQPPPRVETAASSAAPAPAPASLRPAPDTRGLRPKKMAGL